MGSFCIDKHGHGTTCTVPKLAEVQVKGERLRDTQFFHYDPAAAVCKAPLFVGKCGKELPRLLHVTGCEIINFGKRACKELATQRQSNAA